MANFIRRFRGTSALVCQAKFLQSGDQWIPSTTTNLSHIARAQTHCSTRNYISEMRRSAFESNILRLLRKEIRNDVDRFPPALPVSQINGFVVDRRPGEQWIRLEKQFGEKELVRIEVTLFDGYVPVEKSSHDGEEGGGEVAKEVKWHLTAIVCVMKEGCDDVLDIVCSACQDALDIDRLYVRARSVVPYRPYLGPLFQELDEKLQERLFEFLEVRGFDNALCTFLHKAIKDKIMTEKIRWLGTVKSFVEKQGD